MSNNPADMTSNEKPKFLTENDMLKYEVAEMQKQLQYCYNRIRTLEAELFDLQREQSVNLGKSYS